MRELFQSSVGSGDIAHHEVGRIAEGALAERSVLILGDAVRDPYVAGFLGAIEFPVHWLNDGFEFENVRYTEPADAVLCTIRHPGTERGGVTVLLANSEAAIPKAENVRMYDRSLIIFKDQTPVVRRDFEPARIVPVERA